jgi:hypothetical protein
MELSSDQISIIIKNAVAKAIEAKNRKSRIEKLENTIIALNADIKRIKVKNGYSKGHFANFMLDAAEIFEDKGNKQAAYDCWDAETEEDIKSIIRKYGSNSALETALKYSKKSEV